MTVKRISITLFIFAIAMFGFGYALVPLYNVFCKVTGLNGRFNYVEKNPVSVDMTRTITVQFDASKNAYLPWKFYPLVTSVKIHPGEIKRIAYYGENDSGHTMTVQAIPSVTPGDAAKYLKKTECFCFSQQTLKNGEGLDMPMIFHLDPAIPSDINTITLSYTLFDATGIAPRKNNQTGKID